MDALSFTGFRHEPLPDSQAYIRLLEILQGDFKDQIVCRLTTWSIDTAPSYYALSYTWGEQTSPVSIVINSKPLEVRANCAYMLQQAFASEASRYFWVDAICIDQASNQEKNHQVSMMGQLYMKAKHVMACVGPHADDSQFLFETIDRKCSLLSSIHAHVTASGSSTVGDWGVINPIPTSRWLALRCFFTMTGTQRKRLADAYMAFMRRSYFSRVWV
jgi:hypothetical protein